LLLQGDVSVSVGGYGFTDQQALIRIARRPGLGQTIRDLAFVFEDPTSTGGGGVQADAKNLLVTVATTGKVELAAELSKADALPESKLTTAALKRFAEYDARLARPMRDVPADAGLTPEQLRVREQRRAEIEAQRRKIELPEPGEALTDDELVDRPVLPARGTVRYGSVERVLWERKLKNRPNESAILLLGGVNVSYHDEQEGRDVVLTAEKIVLFVSKDADTGGAPPTQFSTGQLIGVYLEDAATISDGSTTVRAPRAFYDLQSDRAVLLDAVVYSYDVRQNVPLYMRADVIRQTSADSFQAEQAIFTTSEFAKPHLSIGASKITLQQARREDGGTENLVTAEDVTVNVGDTPIFYWPKTTVDAGAIPLRRVEVGYESENGAEVQTKWDVFALTNTQAPEGVDWLANIDARGEHGVGLGTELNYRRDGVWGDTTAYFLPNDSGTDEIARRLGVGFDNETRGFFRARHRQELPAGWELWLEANSVSDPTFLEEFFPNEAYAQSEYETSAYFKKAEDDWALTALIKGEVNNFTPQYAPLLTPGYTVNKLPEFEYRLITSAFDDSATFYHESRVGRMRAVFGDDSPGDRGFNAAQSAAAFGIAPGTSFDQAALAAGFPRSIVTRLDSRSEITAPFRTGVFDFTPFAVGRLTAYDDDFTAFNGGNNDQARLWGGAGIRVSTAITKTDNDFQSSLLDVNGVRHIIEPGVTLAFYDTTMNSTDLPIYDPEVERLTEGGVFRVGALQTWQTKRGGPGRRRSVDWITLRTDLIFATEDAPNPASIGRYYDYRPEYTLGDDHFYTELMWAVTEATAITGDLTHNFDQGSVVQWRVAIENEHTDRLSSFIAYRDIDVLDARLLSYGAQLQLTSKYRAGVFQILDFGEGNSRTINLTLERRLPRASLGIVIGYDDIDGEATASIVLTPEGINRALNTGFFR
ncbi:MAG: LPS assembly protein LptD, partial [Phycisphaeraceae bacterium]|nr:LPS assembly protein LptD [Phycisphaeraceae bacterium]